MKTRRGFTLLELMMVVIIIGILASIALPQYLRTVERSRAAEALQVLAAVRSSEIRARTMSTAVPPVYEQVMANLDIDIPGVGGQPPSQFWTYDNLTGTGPGTNATATRRAGGPVGSIQIDLDGGASCATINVWGLPTGAC